MYPANHYLLRWRGQQSGPFSLMVIEQKLDEHVIGLTCEIQSAGRWITLEEFFADRDEQRNREAVSHSVRIHHDPARSSLLSPSSAPVSGPATGLSSSPQDASGRSAPAPNAIPVPAGRRRIVFALLGIFFGFLGVHNFYAGNIRIGILQVALTGLAIFLGFNLIFTWVWALVEVLFVRTDSRGAPLS